MEIGPIKRPARQFYYLKAITVSSPYNSRLENRYATAEKHYMQLSTFLSNVSVKLRWSGLRPILQPIGVLFSRNELER